MGIDARKREENEMKAICLFPEIIPSDYANSIGVSPSESVFNLNEYQSGVVPTDLI